MNSLKYLFCILFFTLVGCGGSGGDGDGNTNTTPQINVEGNNNTITVAANTGDQAADIIDANTKLCLVELEECCKSHDGNPVDGVTDDEAFAQCKVDFPCNAGVFVEACRFEA